MQALISFRRGGELAYGREFHFGVAPSWHPEADFSSAWRRADIQTRIPLREGAQLECGRGFHFGVAPSWDTDADSTSAPN